MGALPGLQLNGGLFSPIPSNADQAQMADMINQIIDKLNSLGGFEVFNGDVGVPITSDPQGVTTIPHGLAFTPGIEAYLNNVGISNLVSSHTLTIPLPALLGVSVSGGSVNTVATMFCMADETNLYFYWFNASGVSLGTFDVTYYLKRQLANQTQ